MEDQQPRRKQLSSAERRLIVDWLLAQSNKGALENGDIKACAERFGTNRKSVAQIWKRYKDEGSTERRRTNSGRRLLGLGLGFRYGGSNPTSLLPYSRASTPASQSVTPL